MASLRLHVHGCTCPCSVKTLRSPGTEDILELHTSAHIHEWVKTTVQSYAVLFA